MESVYDATAQAFALLFTGDDSLWTLVNTSFLVSVQAVLYITPPALVLAFTLVYLRFPGRRLLISIFHSLLAMPAIVVGLVLYLLFSRAGAFGDLQLLFTQTAMVIGQMLLAFPIVVALGHAALQATDRVAWETARTLGASRVKGMLSVMHDARFGLMTALLTAFGRVISEVGCALIVGGSILHHSRNITTAIKAQADQGAFAEGIALGVVLSILSLILSISLNTVNNRLQHV
ncbi:MAG: ABC transporter permease [Saprospiraceae bacterium]|nr:ABC transporter permease [Saprospiraceae bacterium]